jgi:hypothetical protein
MAHKRLRSRRCFCLSGHLNLNTFLMTKLLKDLLECLRIVDWGRG